MNRSKKNRSKKSELSLKARWLFWYENRSPVFRFGLKFGLLLVLLYVLLAIPFFDRALYGYLEANAWLANVILRGLGQPTHVSEVTIQSPQFAMAIRRGCDAVEPTWLLCAAMISFPAPLAHKLKGMLVGIVLLQALNLVRIVTLYWILSAGKRDRKALNRMLPLKKIIGPGIRFAVIFGLLIFPWPGLNDIYGGYFRALGQAVFSGQNEQRIVKFQPQRVQHGFSSLDTQLSLSNRALVDSSGQGKVVEVSLDTRSIGWLPTALTLALILATPVPWRQRGWVGIAPRPRLYPLFDPGVDLG